tara:strand:- start:477 stop:953 length:477 start_codon:yes stop_codon:yes gene_type:complete
MIMNRNVLYLFCILLFSFSGVSQAQSNSYPQIQKLLNQTKGQRLKKDMFENESLVSQSITANSFTIVKKDKELGQLETRYYDVPWKDKFRVGCADVKYNKKIIACDFYFEKDFKYTLKWLNGNDEATEYKTSIIGVYLIKKDKNRDEFFDMIRPFRSN